MITFLHGTLSNKHPTRIEVNVGGVGYEVFIPLSSYDRLPAPGAAVRILTYHHVREDVHALYGFMTASERELFLLLLGISGIGPKIALSALSGMSVRDIKACVAEGNVKRLSTISGIGRKTAERIVVELKDKLSPGEALEAVAGAGEPAGTDARGRDAVLALISLGYKQAEAQAAVRKALARGEAATVEDLVRAALAG
jgi:Holliday junction DNA helicase RuvA